MKKTIILLLLLIIAVGLKAQKKQLFDGGMMVHTGYLIDNIPALDYKASGMSFGLGGVLRFHIGDHVRLGGEGYVSTLPQKRNGSYVRMGWGGVVADFYWPIKRWAPYAGLCVGGGKTSTLLVLDGSDSDWESETNAVVHKEPFFFVNPYLGVEFALTEAVHLTLKADHLFPFKGEAVPKGVRVYFGFVFSH